MAKAVWNGAVLAESDKTIVVEGNHYFPPDSINPDYFVNSSMHTTCPWKGRASYYHVVVDGVAMDDRGPTVGEVDLRLLHVVELGEPALDPRDGRFLTVGATTAHDFRSFRCFFSHRS